MTMTLHSCSRIHELRRDPQLAAIAILASALDATEHALLAVHTRLPHACDGCCALPGHGDDNGLALAIVFAVRALRDQIDTYTRVCTFLRADDRPPQTVDDNRTPPDDEDINF